MARRVHALGRRVAAPLTAACLKGTLRTKAVLALSFTMSLRPGQRKARQGAVREAGWNGGPCPGGQSSLAGVAGQAVEGNANDSKRGPEPEPSMQVAAACTGAQRVGKAMQGNAAAQLPAGSALLAASLIAHPRT